MKHKLLLLLAVISITGCSQQELRHDVRSAGSRAFEVEEAKQFFETDFAGLLTRSSDSETQGKRYKGKLHPGDIDLETIAPGYVEDEEPETPTPDPEPDPEDEEEDEFPEDDTPTEDEEIDEEMVALGREGVEKIKEDLADGKVSVYQYLNGALTGLGVGANSNGIITSAANFVESLAGDTLFQAFGRSISAAGIVCGVGQTFIAIQEGEEFSTGDWMNIISTTLGAAAFIATPFPVAAGTLGIASGIIGIVSAFFSYNTQPGLYVIPAQDGTYIYVYIINTLMV